MKDTSVKTATIYKITCLQNGKSYIGWTINGTVRRYHVHLSQAKRGSPSILHKAIRKYGKEAFVVEELYATRDIEHAKLMEAHFIQECNTFHEAGHGYNMTLGGDGVVGYPCSEYSKRRTSERMKGVPKSNEQRAKISAAHLGKVFSEETRERMSRAKVGCKQTPEHIKKRAQTQVGKKRSEETREKIKESWTPERRAAMAERSRHLVRTDEHKRKISEAVRQARLRKPQE